MNDTQAATDVASFKVVVAVEVRYEPVHWEFVESEDYYVWIGERIIGIVGAFGDGWDASSALRAEHSTLTGIERRTYSTRRAATQALVSAVVKVDQSIAR